MRGLACDWKDFYEVSTNDGLRRGLWRRAHALGVGGLGNQEPEWPRPAWGTRNHLR